MIAPRLTAVALVAAIAALGGCGEEATERTELPQRSYPPERPDGFFGINGQGLRPLAEDGQLDLLDRHLATIAAGGIDFIRANIDWTRLEPAPPGADGHHHYEFDGLDAWMRSLSEHGLSWEAVVMGVPTPAWAARNGALVVCGSRAAPARPADVGALAGAIARRYGRGGQFWTRHPGLEPVPVTEYELWNEPNLGSFWCPVPDPAAYAAVADAMANAILAADRGARLILGGLAGFHRTDFTAPGDARYSSASFLERMLAARPGLAAKLDVIGVHAYGATAGATLSSLAAQRAAVDEAGLARKPLAYNETGWYTSGVGPPPPVDEDVRAGYMSEVTSAVARSNCDIVAFVPHTWITRETNPLSIEDWYGIAAPDSGTPYPTAEAYIDQVLLFEGRGSEPPPTQVARICD